MSEPLFDLNHVPTCDGPKVPNELPTVKDERFKIAIVGEAPGAEEQEDRRPFVGPSGRILRNLLANAGIPSTACYFGNVCQYRPPHNNISRFTWYGAEIQEGLQQLEVDLKKVQPNVVLLLGNTAMKAAGRDEKVTNWRGSLFRCTDVHSPMFGMKCLPTYHPAAVLRQWSWMPLMRFDIERCKKEAETRELHLPQRTFELDLGPDEIIERIEGIEEGTLTSIDLEGGVEQGIKCYAISTHPLSGFIVPFGKFSVEDEIRIIDASRKMFGNPKIPKVLQNSLYDNFVFTWCWKAPLYGVVWDTMLGGWEIYPELPKALGVQGSIYTKEPYYKYERTMGDIRIYHQYCCKDASMTLEIAERQIEILRGDALRHFQFNMQLLPIMMYMELRGLRYDQKHAAILRSRTRIKQEEVQRRINARRGAAINLNSPKQVCEFLYDELGFPVQHPKEGNTYNRSKRTSGADALLNLSKQFSDPILHEIQTWRKIDKIRTALEYKVDSDGRMRCSYNVVGTDTGRLACHSSPTGGGSNLQTITSKLRVLYLADEGHDFGKFDLAGADGWTVAAHCARLGDRTMLLDYRAGVKPAKVIALMYQHGSKVTSWSRERILEEGRDIGETEETKWLYFACKRVQHGSNYGLGIPTMRKQILKDSDKLLGQAIDVPTAECRRLQDLYMHGRYVGVQNWQRWVKMQITEKGSLACASGHVRKFFGRATDNKTYQSALSHEPQANTCYATNLILVNIWTDPTNRRDDGSLIVQPLHQMHDEVDVQWPSDQREWAIDKMRHWSDNKLDIAGMKIKIPMEGGWGPSWGAAKNHIDMTIKQ